MWNYHRDYAEARNGDGRDGQDGVPRPSAADHVNDAEMSQEDRGRPQASQQVAQIELSRAYAALLADNEAFRARLEREKTRVIETEKAALAQVLLDSTDDLERALAAVAGVGAGHGQALRDLTHGVRLSLEVLYKRTAELGAERMSTIGQRFDPQFAEAVNTIGVTDPAQDGIIIQEIRAGYLVGDRLLRPARVRVGQLARR
jgi:molecular chaperone GrpE